MANKEIIFKGDAWNIRDSVKGWSMVSSFNRSFSVVRFVVLVCAAALLGACAKQEESAPASGGSSSSSATQPAPAGEFEGEIHMKIEPAGGQQMFMTYFVKGSHSRMETEIPGNADAGAVMLWDVTDGKITTLVPQRKMYMTMDLKAMAESMGGLRNKTAKEGESKLGKLTSTGKQETIAGHSCEHWLIGDGGEVDICVAKGLGYFGLANSPWASDVLKSLNLNPAVMGDLSANPEWARLMEGGAFPLKVTVLKNGRPEMNMEATKVERKKLDDGWFTVPPDYTEMKLGR